jgi:protein-disulfide isomerase
MNTATPSQAQPVKLPRAPHLLDEVEAEMVTGKLSSAVVYRDGLLFLSVSRVERAWMPFALFGKTIVAKAIRLGEGSTTFSNTLARGLQATSILEDGDAGTEAAILGAEWPMAFREKVREKIIRALAGRAPLLSLQIRGIWALLAVLFFAYLCIAMLTSHSQGGSSVEAVPPAAQSTTPTLSSAEQDQMSSSNFAQQQAATKGRLGVKEAITAANKIVVNPGAGKGKSLVIWSDLLCPHCRDTELSVLSQLPKDIGVTIIPVAFKQSRIPASYVLCGVDDADRAARWKGLMAPVPHGDIAQQCAAGPDRVDANSALFLRAGLTSTPSIMSSNGQLFTGDSTNLSEVAGWVTSTAK